MTFFRYAGINKLWSFAQMGLAPRQIAETEGLRFWKLLGSGAGTGFSLRPDFSAYAFFGVWDQLDAANRFFDESAVMQRFAEHSEERWTLFMRATKSKGTWGGEAPFEPVDVTGGASALAVVTRASIKRTKALTFWRSVPETSRAIEQARGVLFSKGVGELPWIEQATFSVWRDEAAVRAFAYENAVHREAIRKTHDVGWYSEDLFARFQPFASHGTWHGRDPVDGVLKP